MPNRLPSRNEAADALSRSVAEYSAHFICSGFGALGIGLVVNVALSVWGVPAGFGQCWLAAWAVYFPASLLRGPR